MHSYYLWQPQNLGNVLKFPVKVILKGNNSRLVAVSCARQAVTHPPKNKDVMQGMIFIVSIASLPSVWLIFISSEFSLAIQTFPTSTTTTTCEHKYFCYGRRRRGWCSVFSGDNWNPYPEGFDPPHSKQPETNQLVLKPSKPKFTFFVWSRPIPPNARAACCLGLLHPYPLASFPLSLILTISERPCVHVLGEQI